MGSPPFVLLPLITCRALRPRGAIQPSLVGLGDIAFWKDNAIGLPFEIFFEAQSHASAYGLHSSCLRLIRFVASPYSRLSTGWVVPFPDRHFSRLLIKRLVAHYPAYHADVSAIIDILFFSMNMTCQEILHAIALLTRLNHDVKIARRE